MAGRPDPSRGGTRRLLLRRRHRWPAAGSGRRAGSGRLAFGRASSLRPCQRHGAAPWARCGDQGGMSDAVILALDAGTSVMKAVAFDLDGRILASEGRANRYDTRADGAVEQDMAATWRDA